jgi:HSP20 family protein
MNGLTKWDAFHDWDPVRELEEFQNRLGSFFRRSPLHQKGDEMSATEWSPLVDILEDDKEFLIKADLPEVRREDVHVTVENNVLSIRGERKLESEERGKRYHRSERNYGVFSRSFSLPELADPSRIHAEFKDGLLKVHLPKSDRPRTKEVEVKLE